jgi:hypothetical protein
MELKDLFYCSEDSYSGLCRMNDWCSGIQGTTVRALRGDATGTISTGSPQYYDVYDGSKLCRAHKVIWELTNGSILDGYVIDHIDGNGLNNSLSNLRMVTEQWNSHNQKMNCNNISGVCGVHLKTEKEYQRWVAQWNTLDSKRQQKSFSVPKFGNEEAFRLACEYREAMIASLNEQGAGYTDDHGKR